MRSVGAASPINRGNLTKALELLEVGDDGRIIFNATFAGDDFEAAYRELEKRYYASEGAEFAEPGMAVAEYITVKNRGDLDTLFRDECTPDVHIDSRSQSVLLDRSAAEFRASLEELSRLVGSPREWLSAVQWVSQRWFLARYEREAVGQDDETYEWSRIVVGESATVASRPRVSSSLPTRTLHSATPRSRFGSPPTPLR